MRRQSSGHGSRPLAHQVSPYFQPPACSPYPTQVASVEEYIGDSGRELEGAAEEIVESYMGEYMQVCGSHVLNWT